MLKIRFSRSWLFPLALLAVSILAYGLQAPWLGYYLDDWIILAAYHSHGARGLMEYAFLGNRPLVFWLWWLGFQILGEAPLGWQLWALLWRWVTVVTAWQVLQLLWQNHPRRNAAMALLFAVYPLFKQQATALTYSFHWICFSLYFVSLIAMIRAARSRLHYLSWSVAGVLTGAVQMFSQEFFVGLELMRPLVLFFALEGELPFRQRLKRTLIQVLPYVLLLGGFVLWRLHFMPIPGSDRNTPVTLLNLMTSPIPTLLSLVSRAIQDIAEGMIGVWAQTVAPSAFAFQPVSNLLAWGIALISGVIAALALQKISDSPSSGSQWHLQALLLGGAALLGGFAPGWAIGRFITDTGTLYNDRFGLAAMFGTSILLVAFLDWALRPGKPQKILVCLLIGLATAQQARTATLYRWSWEEQRQIFWQLKWRAPDIQPYTAVFGNGALAQYMGSWANISALNLLYFQDIPDPAYTWYFDLYRYPIARFVEEKGEITDEKNFLEYRAPASQSLVIVNDVVENQCLWLVSEADQHNPYLEDIVRSALPLSDLSRILPAETYPVPTKIFGAEPPKDWCWYYQKARLAEEQSDWQAMMNLWKEANGQGYDPHNEPEMVPFILAAAHTGNWDKALEFTDNAYYPSFVMHDYLCTTWRRIRDEVPDSPEKQEALQQAIADFDCQSIIRP